MFYSEILDGGRVIPSSFNALVRHYKLAARRGWRPLKVYCTDDPIYLGM